MLIKISLKLSQKIATSTNLCNHFRCTLEHIQKPADEFVDYFMEKLKILFPHSFVSKQQYFIKALKEKLTQADFWLATIS